MRINFRSEFSVAQAHRKGRIVTDAAFISDSRQFSYSLDGGPFDSSEAEAEREAWAVITLPVIRLIVRARVIAIGLGIAVAAPVIAAGVVPSRIVVAPIAPGAEIRDSAIGDLGGANTARLGRIRWRGERQR